MKFSVNKTDIRGVLGRIQGLTGRRTNFAITETVLLDAADGELRMTATDLETGFEGRYPAVVEEPGVIAVNARKLFEIVKDFPSELIRVAEVENRWIEIGDQAVEYHLVGLDPEEFPDMPSVAEARFAELPADVLKRMIECSVIIAPPPEDNRAHVTGVYLERIVPEGDARSGSDDPLDAPESSDAGEPYPDEEYPEPEFEADGGDAPAPAAGDAVLRMVSTDSSRLSTVDHPLAGGAGLALERGVIIPKKGLQEVAKFLEGDDPVGVAVMNSHFIAKKAAETVTVRLLEGDFPRYAEIMAQSGGTDILMNRQLFLMTLRRMSILSNEKYNGVIFDFSEGRLLVSATNPDLGESKEEVALEYEGEPMSLAFNPKFFIDALGVIGDDRVIVHIINADRPCRVRGENDARYVSVIMPMKL
jgi:DNA polymerase III subunit beta